MLSLGALTSFSSGLVPRFFPPTCPFNLALALQRLRAHLSALGLP